MSSLKTLQEAKKKKNDEFQQKFDINNKECPGKVKTQQSIQVVDIKQLNKKQKGLF